MTMMASSALSSVGRRLLVVRKVATHRYQKVATVVALPNRPGQGLAFHRERLSNNNAGVVASAAANATSTTGRRSASSASASSASAARSRDTPPSKTLPSPPTEENDEGAVDPAVYDHLQFTLSPPDQLTVEMARGIAESTQFFLLHGLPYRRLQLLAQDEHMPVVTKWQKMLETFLSTQIHVLAGMGYGASEQGLSQYAQDLSKCLSNVNDNEDVGAALHKLRRDTWRSLVATAFDLHPTDIPTLSIVDARNIMHKVSSKMIEPSILQEIETRAQNVLDPDPEVESAQKHDILQQIIVDHVYLGGKPSITEEAGFGTGPQAYAKLQCAMSDHEGDPLIAQYATAAMLRIWQAAGLDMTSLQQQPPPPPGGGQ